jgi:hypothetical protein
MESQFLFLAAGEIGQPTLWRAVKGGLFGTSRRAIQIGFQFALHNPIIERKIRLKETLQFKNTTESAVKTQEKIIRKNVKILTENTLIS